MVIQCGGYILEDTRGINYQQLSKPTYYAGALLLNVLDFSIYYQLHDLEVVIMLFSVYYKPEIDCGLA